MLTSAQRQSTDMLLRRLRVVDPASGTDEYIDVSVRQGRIAAMGHHLSAAPEQREVDAEGLTATPAFVDPHVHVRVPGGADVEDIASATEAAARGGYCAIVSMPNTDPVVDSPEVLRSLHRDAARDAVIPIGFAAAISKGQNGAELAELCSLADAGAMLFTDDGKPVESAALLRRAMQYQLAARVPIALHSEDPQLSAGGVMHEGAVSMGLGLEGIPACSESIAIARDVRIAASVTGARVHIQHLSCADSLAEIEWARARGLQVTAEVSPHHLLLTDEAAATCHTSFKMNPPLRTAADRDALVEGLRSGLVDCVATDHAPHARHRKEQPFELAPFGVTGLETAFSSLYTGLVEPGRMALDRLVSAMSYGPANVLGITAPRITVGTEANLAIFDLDAVWTVEAADFRSKSVNSPFVGRRLRGRCVMTVASGAVAWNLMAGRSAA